MSQHLACVTVTVLAAPADGVAPAVLLSITDSSSKGRTLGQYLINAPEGVSRLMLEHKRRPGLHFKALLLSGCSAAEAGGLGGLLLRLKQDGHGSMQLVGPAGRKHVMLHVICYFGCYVTPHFLLLSIR
jgi:ribonuclease Z